MLFGFDDYGIDEELVGLLAGRGDDVVVAVFAGLDCRFYGNGLAPVDPDEGDDLAEPGFVFVVLDEGLFAPGVAEIVRIDLADVLVGGRVGECESRRGCYSDEKQDQDEKSHLEKFRGRAGKSNLLVGEGAGHRLRFYKDRIGEARGLGGRVP